MGMAAGGATSDYAYLKDVLADFTYCSICKQVFHQPKLLKCHHSFCMSCLEQWKAARNSTTSISCPECKQQTDLNEAGIAGLSNDFKTEGLIDGMIKPYLEQLQKKRDDVASQLAKINLYLEVGGQSGLNKILKSIDEQADEMISRITARVDELKIEAEVSWQRWKEQRREFEVTAEAHREQLNRIKYSLDEVIGGPANGVVEQRRQVLNWTAPTLNAEAFLHEELHLHPPPHFESNEAEVNIGRLTSMSTKMTPDMTIRTTIPSTDCQPAQPLLPTELQILAEINAVDGCFAFDPEGRLLLLIEGGFGYLLDTNGEVHKYYENTKYTKPGDVAIIQTRVAVIDSAAELIGLLNRDDREIAFKTAFLESGQLLAPHAVEFLSNGQLVVCEHASFAILGKGAELLRRVDLDFLPSFISVNNANISLDTYDHLLVSHGDARIIHAYELNHTNQNATEITETFECKDEHGMAFKPSGICFDKSTRLLSVCDHDNKRILQMGRNSFISHISTAHLQDGPITVSFNQFGQFAVSLSHTQGINFRFYNSLPAQ